MPRRTTGGDGKKLPLNMRTTRALRDKIDKAAGKSGRSLVQEVEYRIEASFDAEDMAQLFKYIVERLDDISFNSDRNEHWLQQIAQALLDEPMKLRTKHRNALEEIRHG